MDRINHRIMTGEKNTTTTKDLSSQVKARWTRGKKKDEKLKTARIDRGLTLKSVWGNKQILLSPPNDAWVVKSVR